MDFNVTMRYLLAKARRESDRGPIFVERLYVGLLTLAEANTRDIARTPSQLEAVKRDIEDVKRFLAKSKIDIWPSCFLIEEALAGRLPFSEVPVADPDSSRFLERARKKAENDRSLSIAPLDVLEANGLAPTPLLRLCVTEISDGPTSKDKADERGLAAFREKLGVSPESSNLSAFSGLTDILSVPLTVEPGESLDRPGVTENKDGAPAASPGGSPLTSVGLAPSSMVRPLELGALILDTYRIVGGPIAGGMGQVWRVRHTGWDVDLALKQPHAKLFKNAAQKANFINECYAWLDLGLHPHIVSCYYIREIGGVPSIFSEWMDGGSLNDWIYSASRSEAPKLYRGGEEAALERSLDVAIQFARGLRFVHERLGKNGEPLGLIHQDVKPENLLLDLDGLAKVADFGLARARATLADGLESVGATMMTPTGGYTPAYCSLEQANGEPLTRRADIYSWAVTVLELFLGERLWMSGVAVSEGLAEYLTIEARVRIPNGLKDLLRRCLREKQEERPYDFGEVEASLLDIYRASMGCEYARPRLDVAKELSGSLNNKALSMLDLGNNPEAEKCWDAAIENDPSHLESQYNYALHLWRQAKINDQEALRRIPPEESWDYHYLMANFQMENGLCSLAENYLKQAETISGANSALAKVYEELSRIKANRVNPSVNPGPGSNVKPGISRGLKPSLTPVIFRRGSSQLTILAISPSLSRILILDQSQGLNLTGEASRNSLGVDAGLEVYDILSKQTLSYHPRPSDQWSVKYANFIDDESYVVTWTDRPGQRTQKGSQGSVKLSYCYLRLDSEKPLFIFKKDESEARPIAGPRTGLFGWIPLYNSRTGRLDILRLEHGATSISLTLPFDRPIDVFIDSEAKQGIFSYTKLKSKIGREVFTIELWDIEKGKYLLTYDLSEQFIGIEYSIIDVNFDSSIILVKKTYNNKSFLMCFKIDDGHLISQTIINENSIVKSMSENILHISTIYSKNMNELQRYELKYINIKTLQTYQTTNVDDFPGTLKYINLNSNIDAILLNFFDDFWQKYSYHLLPKPDFGYKAVWALSRVKSSLERINEDASLANYLNLSERAHERMDIAEAVINSRAARTILGYHNDSRYIQLRNKIRKYCRLTSIVAIRKLVTVPIPSYRLSGTSMVFVPRFGFLSVSISFEENDQRTLLIDPDSGGLLYEANWPGAVYARDGLSVYYFADNLVRKTTKVPWGPKLKQGGPESPLNSDGYVGLVQLDTKIHKLSISPDELYYAVTFDSKYRKYDFLQDKHLRVYSLKTNDLIYSFEDSEKSARFLDFSMDGEHILIHDQSNGAAKLINLRARKKGINLPSTFTPEARFLPGGITVIGPGQRKAAVWLYNIGDNDVSNVCDYHSENIGLAESEIFPDGAKIVVTALRAPTTLDFWDINSQSLLSRFDLQSIRQPYLLCISGDGSKIAVLTEKNIEILDIDWDFDFPGWTDWDEGARPYLDNFLRASPNYDDSDLSLLIGQLQNAGYGFLKRESVLAKLDQSRFGW